MGPGLCRVTGVLLIYPPVVPILPGEGVPTSCAAERHFESHRTKASYSRMLTYAQMQTAWDMYLGPEASRHSTDKRVCFFRNGNHRALRHWPPTRVVSAKYDVLHSDSSQLVSFLRESGAARVVHDEFDDIHGFFGRFGHGLQALNAAMQYFDDLILARAKGSHMRSRGPVGLQEEPGT